MTIVLVSIGGFLGAISRYWFSQKLNTREFPYGTLIVNFAGAFLLGGLTGGAFLQEWMPLVGVGFLGAFTTFSTLNCEVLHFYQTHKGRKAFLYLGISYTGGIIIAYLGYILALLFVEKVS